MTTGSRTSSFVRGTNSSYLYDPRDNSWNLQGTSPNVGTRESTTWSGADGSILKSIDRPTRGKYRVITSVNRKGKPYKFRVYEPSPTPKRSRDSIRLPHNYTKTVSRTRVGELADLKWKSPGVNGTFIRTNTYYIDNFTENFRFTAPSWSSQDDANLLSKLSEKTRGGDFDLSVFLGEGRESLHMIADSAKRIAAAYRSFHKGNVIGAINELMPSVKHRDRMRVNRLRSAKTWLELQYGWLPLLSDIKSGAEFLAQHLNFPFKQRFVVRKRKSKDIQAIKAEVSAGFLPTDGKRINSYGAAAAYNQKQIVAVVEEQNVYQLSGILDPEIVAWELFPFSFVADWAFPIGQYLENRAHIGRLKGTFITSTLSKMHYSNPNCGNGVVFYNADRTELSFTRVVSTSLNVPMPTVKSFDKIASWQHCANAIALLTATVMNTDPRKLK